MRPGAVLRFKRQAFLTPTRAVIFALVCCFCFQFQIQTVFAADESPDLLPPLEAKLDTEKPEPVKERVEVDPDKKLAVEYLRHGAKLHKSGNVLIAESFFLKATKLDPDNPDGYFNLGALYEARGDDNEALMHYRLGLARSPDDPELVEAIRYLEAKVASSKEQPDSFSSGGPFSLKSSLNTAGLNKANMGGVGPVISVGQTPPAAVPSAAPAVAPNSFSTGKTRVILGTLLRMGLRVGLRAAIGGGGCIGF